MPRHLVIGNGKFLVNLDEHAYVRDIYYPYVGQLNHTSGYPCRIGVWVDGQFSWLSDPDWTIHHAYQEETLVTHVVAKHDRFGIALIMNDAVHQRDAIYLKRVNILNRNSTSREVRLFFHQDLSINETEIGDTAVYYPENGTLFHYKKDCYFMFNGCIEQENGDTANLYQYSTGIKRFHQAEGTWKDAEDGHLMGNPIAQGSVDSTFSLRTIIPGSDSRMSYYWFTVGNTLEDVKQLEQVVQNNRPDHLIQQVSTYWKRWVNQQDIDFADLDSSLVRLYKLSLLIVRTQTDVNGAIIAANDTDILQYNRDHYSYMWPRDGALVAQAMSAAGYHRMIAPFFRFCANVLTSNGYLLHKYNPDGTVGSSWHPYLHDGKTQLPIQEDETGLVLWALWQCYEHHQDIELSQSLYQILVYKAADFLFHHQDAQLLLPLPSYDLWEERFGIFTFTSSAVYGGLTAASHFAALFGDEKQSARFRTKAEEIKFAMLTHLWNEQSQYFARGLYRVDGKWTQDTTPESSVISIYTFGVLPAEDARVRLTVNVLKKKLSIHSKTGGIARYWKDHYFQKSTDLNLAPGNPWIICTLWFAAYDIAVASTLEELETPRNTLHWIEAHSLESGLLPEQLDPFDGSPISVAPLTWSHATYIDTVLKYVQKYRQLSESANQRSQV